MGLRTKFASGFGVSALAIAFSAVALPGVAMAQDAAPADDQETAPDITVTGYRVSLENAVNNKKKSDMVVESVSAEDIGKLPDASIAESIARLPGLTSQRLSGRSNSITIRGFAPDFSTTLLNGREQTSTGDNRAVEYDQYPSEVVSQVNVYKTPMASLVGQGLSGTVDLRTIRPLEAGKRVISIGARGSYADLGALNAGSKSTGWRANMVYVDQFKDDTIGLALSAGYLDESYQTEEFNAWGYADGPGGNKVIGGSKSYNTSSRLKRFGLQGTLELRLTPSLTSTFDGFYSDFKDDNVKRGIELPLQWGGGATALLPGYTASNGLITDGSFSNVTGIVRNDLFQRHAKLYSFGWNLDYKGDDGWDAMLDVSYSRTKRNELALESYAGTGRAFSGAKDTIGFNSSASGTTFSHNLNYGDYSTILLTMARDWGGNQTAVNGDKIINGQDGYYNNRIVDDKLYQVRGGVTHHFDGALESVQVGLNYTDRNKSLVPDEYFIGLTANTTGTVSVPVPAQYQRGTTNLAFLGLGPVISYDPLALIEGGVYHLVPNPYGDVVVKSYSVTEKQMTGFIQANIKADVGSAQLTGNFGGQVIVTSQRSSGAQASNIGTNPNGSPIIVGIPQTLGKDYTDFLPSLNLSLRFPSDFVIRFSAAREIVRPRLDDMRASVSYATDENDPGDPTRFTCPVGRQCRVVKGSSGNPYLEPWRANAVDLTFEKYFGTKGYIAAQLFYKDLKSYVYNADLAFDWSGYPIAAAKMDNGDSNNDGIADRAPLPFIINPQGSLNVPINGKGGSLYGAELAGTLPLGELVPALDGFGLTGGVSYSVTKIRPNPGGAAEDLPGYSKWVANGTMYYENGGFNLRGSVRYRSTFVGEVSGFAANRTRRRAASETIIDAQVGYDFQPGSALEGLSLFVQGQNLTEEPFVTYNPGDPRQVIDYQNYGRRFLAGFTYKF